MGNELMIILGAAVGYLVIGPAINGPIMGIIGKVTSGGGGDSGGSSKKGGTVHTGYFASTDAMVGGMLTHYPN